MISYINFYANGGTSRRCASRRAADNSHDQVSQFTTNQRICVWRIESDEYGRNATITVEDA
jgi:hypothetical protein